MKKIILIVLAMIFMTSLSFGQVWYSANQKTIAWDPVTTFEDGSPIPSGETIRYQIYISAESDITKISKISVGNTTATQYTVNFTTEGKYFIGIEAERLQGETVISKSPIAWSDNATYCQNGETFGISFFRMPMQPKELRPM